MALSPLKIMATKTDSNTKYYVGIAGFLLVLLIALIIFYFSTKRKKTETAAAVVEDIKSVNSTGIAKPSTAQKTKANLDLLLKKGMDVPEVGTLQEILNFKGASLTVDDNFGQKTEDALLSIAGKKETTLNAMSSLVAGFKTSSTGASTSYSWFS